MESTISRYRIVKSLGKGSFLKKVLQIIRLNTLVDVIRVPNYVLQVNSYQLIQILSASSYLFPDFFRGLFSPHSKAKANHKRKNLRKMVTMWYK